MRILIADDHTLVRAGLTSLIAKLPGMEVVAEAADGRQALRMVRDLQPDLVLMDIAMPGLNGLESAERIHNIHPHTKIVILSMHASEEYVAQALKAGASGYLLKDASHDELMSTLRKVEAGQAQIAPSVTRKLVREFASLRQAKPEVPAAQPAPARPPELSPREYEVLTLLVRGYNNRQIATELFIDETTVKTHLHRIFEKLQVRDRTQAAIMAVQRGWCAQAAAA